MLSEVEYWKERFEELKIAADLAIDQITIADSNGIFYRVYKSANKDFGIKEDIIGKSCFDLEKQGVFDISSTAEVIRKKQKVRLIQKTNANRILMVTGYPIFDENNNIVKIINISYDITERKSLEAQLEETETTLQWYRHEHEVRNQANDNTLSVYSKSMSRIKDLIDNFAYKDILILLLGDTGVGKNYIAHYIHNTSSRNKEPFVTLNCGAIPEQLLESELFGYEKGSFTGALNEGKQGLFEFVGNGTILLDEIAELPLDLQVKLLEVLDERKFRRIGGHKEIELKARIIVATNKNLEQCVKDKTFREDLYYRINILPIKIPSLAERKEDIPDLINKFLNIYNEKYGTKKTITNTAYQKLLSYNYPGNIRELKNIIERLTILSDTNEISDVDVDNLCGNNNLYCNNNNLYYNNNEDYDIEIVPLKEGVCNYEKKLLTAAAKKYKTTREQAKILGVDQSTIVKKRKKYNL